MNTQKINYKFDPTQYGFEPIDKFPELKGWFGSLTFIKISAFGDEKTYGRKVYWYLACTPLSHDDRFNFYQSAYSADKPAFSDTNKPRETYLGTINSDDFAKQLLYNLLGTGLNKNVLTDGLQRFNTNLNEKLREEYP